MNGMNREKEVRKEKWDASMCAYMYVFLYIQGVSALCYKVRGMLQGLPFCGRKIA